MRIIIFISISLFNITNINIFLLMKHHQFRSNNKSTDDRLFITVLSLYDYIYNVIQNQSLIIIIIIIIIKLGNTMPER